MDEEKPPGLHPALAAMTHAEALAIRRSVDGVDVWLRQHGLSALPPKFMATVGRLIFELEEKEHEIATVRQSAAKKSPANLRRRDLARLRFLYDQVGHALPLRQREVAYLCFCEGLSIAEAANRLEIAPSTVRTYIKRLRELARRNRHVLIPRD